MDELIGGIKVVNALHGMMVMLGGLIWWAARVTFTQAEHAKELKKLTAGLAEQRLKNEADFKKQGENLEIALKEQKETLIGDLKGQGNSLKHSLDESTKLFAAELKEQRMAMATEWATYKVEYNTMKDEMRNKYEEVRMAQSKTDNDVHRLKIDMDKLEKSVQSINDSAIKLAAIVKYLEDKK